MLRLVAVLFSPPPPPPPPLFFFPPPFSGFLELFGELLVMPTDPFAGAVVGSGSCPR